jgi:hypothetical protein
MIEWIPVIKDVAIPLYDRFGKPLKELFFRPKLQPQAQNWAARLTAELHGRVRVFGITPSLPTVRVEGAYELAPELRKEADEERRRIAGKQPNDPHAILAGEPVWTDNPVVFTARTLEFADVTVLRRAGQRPPVLSADAVIFCAETRELVLHRRSDTSATFPGALHVIGGAYIPASSGREADRHNLFDTARREAFEETRATLAWDDPPALLLSHELDTGFIQVALLGVNISAKHVETLEGSLEGSITRVSFADLPHRLREECAPDAHAVHRGWVPSGKAHVLAWLALGAPGMKKPPKFGGLSPVALFDLCVRA